MPLYKYDVYIVGAGRAYVYYTCCIYNIINDTTTVAGHIGIYIYIRSVVCGESEQ